MPTRPAACPTGRTWSASCARHSHDRAGWDKASAAADKRSLQHSQRLHVREELCPLVGEGVAAWIKVPVHNRPGGRERRTRHALAGAAGGTARFRRGQQALTNSSDETGCSTPWAECRPQSVRAQSPCTRDPGAQASLHCASAARRRCSSLGWGAPQQPARSTHRISKAGRCASSTSAAPGSVSPNRSTRSSCTIICLNMPPRSTLQGARWPLSTLGCVASTVRASGCGGLTGT